MKNLFIDLGTHMGGGLLKFITKYDMTENLWEIHTFEPQPTLFELADKNSNKTYVGYPYNFSSMNKALELFPSIIRYNKAASDHDGIADFYIEQQIQDMHMGSSLNKDRITSQPQYFNFENKVQVETINIFSFIKNILDSKNIDKLVIKIDVEGAEFLILNKFIKEFEQDNKFNANSIEIYCEFHHRLFPRDDIKYPPYDYYFNILNKYKINLYDWE